MAEYRQLKVAFWNNPFVLGLSPEERAFYVFMLTNPATTNCGVFELSIRMIVTMHGYTEIVILALIQKFVSWKKLAYDPLTNEFYILNWMKHHKPVNPTIQKTLIRELMKIKSETIKTMWSENIHGGLTMGSLWGHGDSTVLIPEIQKDINSSVPGYSSVVLHKEVVSSLPGLKEEEPEPKDHKDPGDQGRDLDHIDLSLRENQPGEERGCSFLDFNLEGEKSKPELKAEIITPHKDSVPPPPDPPPPPSPEEDIIRYLNTKLCSGYRLDSGVTRSLIQKKLGESFTLEDFRTVIDKKVADWGGTRFASNLCPHLLFGDNFEAYLQQAPRSDHRERGYGQRIPISTFHNHTSEIVEVF